jgi:hypothetical protein
MHACINVSGDCAETGLTCINTSTNLEKFRTTGSQVYQQEMTKVFRYERWKSETQSRCFIPWILLTCQVYRLRCNDLKLPTMIQKFLHNWWKRGHYLITGHCYQLVSILCTDFRFEVLWLPIPLDESDFGPILASISSNPCRANACINWNKSFTKWR